METIIGYNGDAKREDLLRMLRAGECRVTFTKVNGEERVMHCTLARGIVPLALSTGINYHGAETDTIAVYDLEKEGWRAFRVASVTEIETNCKS